MSALLWHDDAGIVRLKTPRMSATVDLAIPSAGLHDIRIDGTSIGEDQLLGVEIAPPLGKHRADRVEHFLRGGDLAATYSDQPHPEARTEVYWRAAEKTQAIASFELLVSVQTNLLLGRPQLAAHSIIAAESVWRLDDLERGAFVEIAAEGSNVASSGWLFRLNSELSYAQLVHPADSHATRCQRRQGESPRYELRHELFAERLEKGVILRARVLGVLVTRANDLAAAAQHFADFLASDPPLTT
jgi:hypothetical protein